LAEPGRQHWVLASQDRFQGLRFPVTVYVVDGSFTLEPKDRAPLTVRAGEAMVEPPNVAMIGSQRDRADQCGHLLRQHARHAIP
jgi:hypothetical protein